MGALTLLTDEEFLKLPESPCRQELLDGELIQLPPSKRAHDRMSRAFAELLRTVVDPSRIWVESGYRLRSGRWLTPDASVSWPDQPETDYAEGAPMLAIEIVSGANTAESMDRKVAAYLEDGAAEIWLVYPKTGTLGVFRKDATIRVSGNDAYRCELLGVTVTPEYRLPPAR